jgi:hypothetical protein
MRWNSIPFGRVMTPAELVQPREIGCPKLGEDDQ